MALGCPACLMLLGDSEEKPAPQPPAHIETLLVVGCLVATSLLIKKVLVPGRKTGRNSGAKPFRTAGIFTGGSGW